MKNNSIPTHFKDALGELQQEQIRKGIEKGLIEIDAENSRINFSVQEKDYELNLHNLVRASAYMELVTKKYPPDRIDFEQVAPSREPPEPADIVIYRDDEQTNAYAVFECESTSEDEKTEEAKREGLGKANNFRADWLGIFCGDQIRFFHLKPAPAHHTQLKECRTPTFPTCYGEPPRYRYGKGEDYLDLSSVSISELKKRFKNCHDNIWESGKRDPAQAFDEMSKLMFCKMHDETFTEVSSPYQFQVGRSEDGKEESGEDVARRILELYSEASEDEPDVFAESIEVDANIIKSVVKELQDISLTETDLDAKGKAFETFLGKMFRGEYGQYFTPRELVRFMVNMVDPKPRELVIDPACGSGGFLLYSMNHVANTLKDKYQDESQINKIYWNFTHDHIFGIEINDRISRIAMMDMVIHEDGHTNIEGGKDELDWDVEFFE